MEDCDFVIPLHRYHNMVRTTIEAIGKFYLPRSIYIITPKKCVSELENVVREWNFNRVIVLAEEDFFIKNYGLSKEFINCDLFNNKEDSRSREFGWWYQQIIKLGAFKQIEGLSDPYIVWDSDLIPLKKWNIYNNGVYKFALLQQSARSEWNIEQYKTSLKSLIGLDMIVPEDGGTFVPHHFVFYHKVLENILKSIERMNNDVTWIHSIISLSHTFFRFSEYIMVATFMNKNYPELLKYYSFQEYGYGQRIREPKLLLNNIYDQCIIDYSGLSYEEFCQFIYRNYDSNLSYMQIEHI
jgi:hypothetical protein